MEILPAIDILDDQVVRLYKGDFTKKTVYGDDPFLVARKFMEEGARWIHVVDLKGAREGKFSLWKWVEKMVSLDLSVEVSGGIRDWDLIRDLLSAGVSRVILSTAFFQNRELFLKGWEKERDRIGVAVDISSRKIRIAGWEKEYEVSVEEVLSFLSETPPSVLEVTLVDRDGTLGGLDLPSFREVLLNYRFPVIVGGGVRDLDDLKELRSLKKEFPNLSGVIVGRALYEGRFTLSSAREIFSGGEA
jgi:phosphoribosylformimino-5-aminoimidazole carboxamide ribotide isomerase